MFASNSRLLLVAPHPDDEALACSVLLQQATRAGAEVRVVYATDGDDNPWPQRVLERKWRLNAADRRRWGRLRRTEAIAALRVLGADPSCASFLGLPDQKLTTLLVQDYESVLPRLAEIIDDFCPTHLLVPSISDTHPDHSALAVMLRLVLSEFFSDEERMSVWSYAVHGKSAAFSARARAVRQSEAETATKVRAIYCHKTQISLSRKRFLGYATRPERLARLCASEATAPDRSIRSLSRQTRVLHLAVRLSMKPTFGDPELFVLGHDEGGARRCMRLRLPSTSSRVEMFDCASGKGTGIARYHGNAFAAEIAIPIEVFSLARALFVKLTRRSWFFDEAGWLEVPAMLAGPLPVPERAVAEEERSLAVR
jgi:LmbE family N-acetylglucosaminyl deacetylase